ncbi:DUF6482 family protein [Alteromonas oceanisediminis]|uniref:DUF6482 family protein n=1 Tax=Alteromonas oceanisediminis TaxID=2836180 RepID=UPI001BD92E0D|nr:DUF6482 family protein [Alteromonas oceanisediminis]MBT0587473.1 NADH-quinone reductase [Alteromonas oceanisediminis]
MNLFIESIEGGTYLAALDNAGHRDYLKDSANKPIAFDCLNEIKSYLAGQTFERVWLKQNTPYDEMVGLDSSDEKLEIEIEW